MAQLFFPVRRILRGIGLSATRPETWALIPSLTLAYVWFGWKGVIIATFAGLSFAVLNRHATAVTDRPAQFPAFATDALTGLPFRPTVETALDTILRHSAETGKSTACLVLCLDDPQSLVERFGQAAHDQVLRRTAERLSVVLRQQDIVSRLEGARFAVALGPVRRIDLEAIIQVAGRMQEAVQDPLSIDAMTIYTSCSVGFCLPSRAPEQTGAALLAAAELATDDAWRNGPSAIRAYSPEIAKAASCRQDLRDEIETALEAGEIVAHFQPQLSTDTGEVTGFEALARWKHPTRGILAPAEFLPAIQSGGLTSRLGEVMLFQSLNALRAWSRAGYEIGNVAVNFSKEELRNPRLVEKLRWELDRFDLSPERLTIEILESVVAETANDMIVHNIAALAELGCGIDLDDFGTGHASITSIRRFTVKRIKIDRSYVTKVDCDPAQQKMIMAILSMAERLGLQTLAEGVESQAEHAMLAQLGCDHVQGFVVARPMPFEETIAWLERQQAKRKAAPRLGRKTG